MSTKAATQCLILQKFTLLANDDNLYCESEGRFAAVKQKNTIAIINQKGGVGKTTSAINLGACLAGQGKKTLIVDGDPQGNATSGLGLAKNKLSMTLYEAMMKGADTNSCIHKTRIKNLSIIPSNADLANAELDLAELEDREKVLKNILGDLQFDYMLIDSPPALGLLTINSLSAADFIIIPVQAEYYALEGLGQLLEVVQRIKTSINPNLEIMGVLLTMYDKRNSLSRQVYDELKNYFSDKIFTTVIPRNIRLAEAPSFGKSIVEHDKWSKGARSYKSLAKEVIDRAS
jgi:chromosome partitioning protein